VTNQVVDTGAFTETQKPAREMLDTRDDRVVARPRLSQGRGHRGREKPAASRTVTRPQTRLIGPRGDFFRRTSFATKRGATHMFARPERCDARAIRHGRLRDLAKVMYGIEELS